MRGIIFGIRDSRFGTPIVLGFGIHDSGRRLFGDSGFAIRDADCFGIRDTRFGTLIIFGVGDSQSRVHRLIAGAVAARVVAAAPEGLSLLSAFLDYALEHRFATFGAEWCIG